MEPTLVNGFTWKIECDKIKLRSEDLNPISNEFEINCQNLSWHGLCLILKKNDFFQFELHGEYIVFPNPVKIKMSLRSVSTEITHSQIIRSLTEFKFSVEIVTFLKLLLSTGSLEINLTMKYPIKKKNNNSSPNFKLFFNNHALSDVVFKIDGTEFPAHKVILASMSEVFQRMFSHNMKENLTNVIIVKETDPNDFKELLNFIYTGQVENLDNVAFGLYDLANKYDIPDLREICEDHLYDSLSSDNVIHVLHLADRQNSVKLKNECIEFIDTHFEQVENTEPFKALNRELLLDLVCAIKAKKPRK